MTPPRPARLTRRALLALLLAPAAARAHDGLHADGVAAAVGAVRRTDKGLEAELTLVNATPVAVTLRGVDCPEATSTRLLRRSSLFGVESWSRADLVRIDPGEQIALARPDYVIEIAAPPAGEDLLNLKLDFGPAGEKTLVLFAPD